MNIKEQIKIALITRNMTLTELHNQLCKKYGKTDKLQNLSSKINRNTLKYSEVQEIADILNYDIKWINNSQEKV